MTTLVTVLKKTPCCGAIYKAYDVASFNTFGAVYWSDGFVSGIPYYGLLGKCKKCKKYFDLFEAESIDSGDHLDNEKKFDFRLSKMKLKDFYKALDKQNWNTDLEFSIRQKILHLENHKYRISLSFDKMEIGCLTLSVILSSSVFFNFYYETNYGVLFLLPILMFPIVILVKDSLRIILAAMKFKNFKMFSRTKESKNIDQIIAMPYENDEEVLLIAECHRYKGEFEKCLELLELVQNSKHSKFITQIRERCNDESRYVFRRE